MATGVVSRRVRAVFRAHVGLVVAESLLVGASAGVATIASTLVSIPRASPHDGQRVTIAILVAILGAIAWALERLEGPEAVARAIDRQRDLRGAVLTAFQSERAERSPSSVAQLLASRISREVSPRSFVRSSWRASAPLLALPWFAIALWSLAAERAGSPIARNAPASPAALAAPGIRERVAAIQDTADRIARTPGLAPDLEAVSRRISEEAARVARTAAQLPAARTEGELRDLERRLDLVRDAIPAEAVTSGDPRGRMTGPDRGTEPAPGAPMAEPSPRATAQSPAIEPGERGVLASKWWPTRYDGVVDRWLEARRQLLENQPR
jgi:hypothetical protein